MNAFPPVSATRRAALVAALGAAALAAPSPAAARVLRQRGLAAGGLVALRRGKAHFSAFATRLTLSDQAEEVVIGSVLWVDQTAGVSIESTEVTNYGPIAGQEETGRRLEGVASVNGENGRPFVLDVFDIGPPGSGKDRVSLRVAGGVGSRHGGSSSPPGTSRYVVSGTLTAGDAQIVEVDFNGA